MASERSRLNLVALVFAGVVVALAAWLLWGAGASDGSNRANTAAERAGGDVEPEPAQTEPPGLLSGSVVEAPDGVPVEHATVTFVSSEGAVAIEAEPDGSWTLQPNATRGTVWAEAPGLRTAGRDDDGVDVVVPGGSSRSNVVVELHAPADVLGRVEIHERPADAKVTAYYESDLSGALNYDADFVETDPEGNFRLIGLAPGRLRLRVEASGAAPLTTEALDVYAGSITDVGLLVLRVGGGVSGVVRNDRGDRLAGARVATRTQPPIESVSNEQGEYFLYGVPSGTVGVNASAMGHQPGWIEAVVAPEGNLDLDIQLRELVGVAVQVVDGEGAPALGAVVSVAGLDGATVAGSKLERVDESGMVHFPDLTGGPFRVEALLDGKTTARVVEAGSSATLVFGGGSAVRGMVLRSDGSAARDARLRLLRGDGESDVVVVESVADANGRFEFQDLEPGTYRVGGSAVGHRYTEGTPLTVADGPVSTTLRLSTGGRLVGTVLDARTGVAIADASVSLSGSRFATRTDLSGGYRYEGLPVERVSIEFSAPGYRGRVMSGIEVADNETRRVDVSLEPAAEGDERPGTEMVGVGVQVKGNPDGSVTIIDPMPGGAGALAGLQPNDKILAVDGTPTSDLGFREVVESIRGEIGTTVTLRIARGEDPPFEVEISREPVVFGDEDEEDEPAER